MPSKSYVPFEPSRRHSPAGANRIADVPDDEHIEISIYLKPRAASPPADSVNPRAALREARSDIHKDDIQLITEFATQNGPDRHIDRTGPAAGSAIWYRRQASGRVSHGAQLLS